MEAALFYVSPSGDDALDGRAPDRRRQSGPFRTLFRARNAVRAQGLAGPRPVTILLRGGRYELDHPLVLREAGRRHAGGPGAMVRVSRRDARAERGQGPRRVDWMAHLFRHEVRGRVLGLAWGFNFGLASVSAIAVSYASAREEDSPRARSCSAMRR